MITSNRGLQIIKDFEKFEPTAYQDQVGIWTIGYGTTRYPDGTRVSPGDEIDEIQAHNYLRHEVMIIESKLNSLIKVFLKQNQWDALVSLTYNIGIGAFRGSSLLKVLNRTGEIDKDLLTRWNKVTIDGEKVTSRGLAKRRELEWQLYDDRPLNA